jgi:hypothetical protein
MHAGAAVFATFGHEMDYLAMIEKASPDEVLA